MGRLAVSVLNELEAHVFSAEFPTHTIAKNFIEWRIEDFLAQGAKYVDMIDKDTHAETRYSAAAIADGVFATIKTDWRYALIRRAA